MNFFEKLLYSVKSGKNSKFVYFLNAIARELCVPPFVSRMCLNRILENAAKLPNYEELRSRAQYYCKNEGCARTLPLSAVEICSQRPMRHGEVYYFDSREFLRYFPPQNRFSLLPGDITYIPEQPSLVKSRPIFGNNANGVLFKLNKIRHFIFANDKTPFENKKSIAIFRGKIKNKFKRIDLFEKYFGNPLVDLGDTSRTPVRAEWASDLVTIKNQLAYKFVLCIEGNDVASNLKWVLSSNSLAIMPKPEFETWFQEGLLIPEKHYVEVAPDYSDLEEKLSYYATHIEESKAIISAAHAWIDRFRNPRDEKIVSLLTLQRYFGDTPIGS